MLISKYLGENGDGEIHLYFNPDARLIPGYHYLLYCSGIGAAIL